MLFNNIYSGVVKDAEWYGVNSHFYYDVTPDVSVGVRAEWFRDRDGFRVFAPGRVTAATDYTEEVLRVTSACWVPVLPPIIMQ